MVPLFHRSFGQAREPVLVVLHGLLGSSRNWQAVGRALAESHWVLAPDLRNHGASPQAPEMDYRVLVEDLLAWMDQQRLGKVQLLGHSLGGKVAMKFACEQPERVSRLLVVDIAPKDYFSYGHRAEFAAMQDLHLDSVRSRAEAEIRLEGRVPDWAMRKFLLTNLVEDQPGKWRWQINLPVLSAALPTLERNPLGSEHRYLGDTCFILGGRSTYVGAEDGPEIEAHFPRVRFHFLPEAGHNPHLDAREAFVQLVRKG